jgi:hypothetical protein
MKKMISEALDDALRLHVVKLFNVLISDPTNLALERFENGIGTAIKAHGKLKVICDKCIDE